MFDVGDYIIYGNVGVCQVDEVGAMKLSGSSDKIYYTLVPLYSKGSKVFTPVDNEKVVMRSVISREEAEKLVDEMKDIDVLGFPEDKKREVVFKEALHKCDCRECVRIIKTLYLRKQERLAEGKKNTSSDEKYLHLAEDTLYGELAVPFNMTKKEVEEFVVNRVKVLDA